MDKRISYKIVLDTETCPLVRTPEVNPKNMLAYDIGWAVVDKRGNVYKSHSFVVKDIFYHEQELMQSAYYADKLPKYYEDIKNGERYVASLYDIKQILKYEIELFGITEIYAHNMFFDYNTLNTTQRYTTENRCRYFFPYGVEICDTLKLARQLIAPMPTYKKFCEENDYLTKNGQVRLTAEIIYRFISGEHDFEEEHQGLADVMIEKEILAYCYRKHKSMNGKLWG